MAFAKTAPLALLSLAAPLALAACAEEEPTYETDTTDVSGGELIVTEETPAVDVELPETPMTPVPEDEAAAEPEASAAPEDEATPAG